MGVGVHSGFAVSLTLGPAPVDAVLFLSAPARMAATVKSRRRSTSVTATEFCDRPGRPGRSDRLTAEHVLAAFARMASITPMIEVDGPEVPIMDGSAAAFVAAIDQAGVVTQAGMRRFIQVLKPVPVTMGDSFGELRPYRRVSAPRSNRLRPIPLIGARLHARSQPESSAARSAAPGPSDA